MFPLKDRYLDEDWEFGGGSCGSSSSSSSHTCENDTDFNTKRSEKAKNTINHGQLIEEEYEMRFNPSLAPANQVDKPSFLKDFFKSFFHL